jgi:hypothetical protein
MSTRFLSLPFIIRLAEMNKPPRSKLSGYQQKIFYYTPQEAGYLPVHPLSAALFDYKISFRKLMKFKSHE